jgi:uncharacterized membrane protein
MNLYQLLVFVHVAAAVTLLSGSIVGSPAVRAAVRRARTTQEMASYLAIGRPLLLLEPVSALAVLASGIYLTNVGNFQSQGWVQVAAVIWLVNAIVAGALVKPALKAVATATAAQPDGAVSSRLNTLRWSRRWSAGGDLLLANDAAVLYLMTMKPELAGSIVLVAVVNLLVVAARAFLGWKVLVASATRSN